MLGRVLHGYWVQWPPDVPPPIPTQGQVGSTVPNLISVVAADAIKAGVKIIRYLLDAQTSNRVWSHQTVECFAKAIGIKSWVRDIKMDGHGLRMHAGVGAARCLDQRVGAGCLRQSVFDYGLDTWAMFLSLPSHKGGTVVFD